MKKMQQQAKNNWIKTVSFFVVGILTGLVMLISVARLSWHGKFYPGITIGGVSVAGLNRDQARSKLSQSINDYQVNLVYEDKKWQAPKQSLEYKVDETLNSAYHYGRRLAISDYLFLLVNKRTDFPIIFAEGATEKLNSFLNEICSEIETPPIDPTIEVSAKKVVVKNGVDGIVIDSSELEKRIRVAYSKLEQNPIVVPTVKVQRELKEEELTLIRTRAEKLLTKNLTLTQGDQKIKLSGSQLVGFLSTEVGMAAINKQEILTYVDGLGESINTEPKDAKFEFLDGVVKEFAPGKDGIEIDTDQTSELMVQTIEKLLNTDSQSEDLQIIVNKTPPKVTTDKVNELGIRERIGRGESYYAHSIPNRIYNVGLASTRANSALIQPGEEFSFNAIVGDISAASGYRSAYVISGGRTVLGDGGGVCQVSTTIFRAAMSAGLPITERWAHAYRVGYYEQNSKPGIDATVYSPSKDLRFKNDTAGHILVQTINDPKSLHLVVEIYGTSDGRVATVSEPKVWGIAPPPPDIIQEDPSLPTGTTKQVDWAAGGAKTSFDYKVVRNGETIYEKTFTSTFKPWANVYLKGTGQ